MTDPERLLARIRPPQAEQPERPRAGELIDRRREAEAREQAAAIAQAQATAWEQTAQRLRGNFEASEQERQRIEAQLTRVSGELDTVRQSFEQAERERNAARQEAEQFQHERDAFQQQLEAAQRDLNQAQQDLTRSRDATVRLQRELETARRNEDTEVPQAQRGDVYVSLVREMDGRAIPASRDNFRNGNLDGRPVTLRNGRKEVACDTVLHLLRQPEHLDLNRIPHQLRPVVFPRVGQLVDSCYDGATWNQGRYQQQLTAVLEAVKAECNRQQEERQRRQPVVRPIARPAPTPPPAGGAANANNAGEEEAESRAEQARLRLLKTLTARALYFSGKAVEPARQTEAEEGLTPQLLNHIVGETDGLEGGALAKRVNNEIRGLISYVINISLPELGYNALNELDTTSKNNLGAYAVNAVATLATDEEMIQKAIRQLVTNGELQAKGGNAGT